MRLSSQGSTFHVKQTSFFTSTKLNSDIEGKWETNKQWGKKYHQIRENNIYFKSLFVISQLSERAARQKFYIPTVYLKASSCNYCLEVSGRLKSHLWPNHNFHKFLQGENISRFQHYSAKYSVFLCKESINTMYLREYLGEQKYFQKF